MNPVQVFSREYLQNVPEQRKQQHIDNIVQSFCNDLLNNAAQGKTCYIYTKLDNSMRGVQCFPPLPVLTNEDLILGFEARFPGCKVSYEESWVESGRDTRTLKKGIVIDWS